MIENLGEITRNVLQIMFWSGWAFIALVCALCVHYKTNKGKWWIWNMGIGAGLRMLVWEFIFCTGVLQILYTIYLYFRDLAHILTSTYSIIWLVLAVIGGLWMYWEYKK